LHQVGTSFLLIYMMHGHTYIKFALRVCLFLVFLALQPCGCIFHSLVAGFSLLILEIS